MTYDMYQSVVDRYVTAFENADVQIIRDIFAKDAVVEDPVGTEPRRGIEAIVEFYQQGFAAGAKLVLTQPVRVAGHSVAFAFDVVMGDMKISPIDVFDFNNEGRIQHMRAYWGPENMVS